MASQTTSTLSNKSALTNTAAPTTAPKVTTSAAAQRRKAQAERQAAYEAREAVISDMIDSYTHHLAQKLVEQRAAASAAGKGWVVIERAYPPSTETITGEDGVEQRVFKHEAVLTHWAGLDEEGKPIPSENDAAVPKVMLLQGRLPKAKASDPPGAKPRADPKLLPGGESVVQRLQYALADHGYGVQTAIVKGQILVIAIWDHKAWKEEQASRQKAAAAASAEKAARAAAEQATLTYDEYKAQQAAKKAPEAGSVAAEDSWEESKPKRKGKKVPTSA